MPIVSLNPLRASLVVATCAAVLLSTYPVRGTTMAVHGMIASAAPMAAEAGLRILQQGGNAFDAAVAVSAVAGVTDMPTHAGMGGVGYGMIYDAKKKQVRALDFIGTAGAATKLDTFTATARLWDRTHPARDTAQAILVPGTVAMWGELLENYGTMSWAQVLAPAIELAEHGFAVTPRLHQGLSTWAVARDAYGSGIFRKNGRPWPVAEILKQTDLAQTLKTIAAGGSKAFYQGPLTEQFVRHFQEKGGILTLKDFADYRALWREPVRTTYRGYEVSSHPPGSGGITVLQALNILEQFDLPALDHNSPQSIHLVSEALKLAFVDDDRFNTGKNYAKIPLERLLSKEYAKEQAARIDRSRAQFYPPVRPGSTNQSEHTINHVIVDKDRNIVTMTQTAMHSRVTVPGTGVAFNSDMTYFSVDPADVNVIEAGQRPRLVMSPTIVMRYGQPHLALGAGGGWTINQTVLQVLLRVLDYDMDAHPAVSAPRFVLRYLDNSIPYMRGTELDLEAGIGEPTRNALAAMGHTLLPPTSDNFGGLSAVRVYANSGVLSGKADPRREGQAVGW
jgi:gamma-glutamyltranspeptidase / glutathione hydrolase